MSSSQFRTVAIAGATGGIGFPIAEAFLADGNYKVKIFRQAAKTENKNADILVAKGAEVIYADYGQQDKVAQDLKGVDVLISTISSQEHAFDLYTIQSPLLAAAKKAGVKRFIPSEFGIEFKMGEHQLMDGKAKLREELEKSGLEYTYIYTGLFQEYLNWVGFDVKNKTATFYANGNTKMDTTCLADIAKYTVQSLKMPEARNAALRVSGETLTLNEIVKKFEKATGSKWKVVEDNDLRQRFKSQTAPVPTVMEDFLATCQQYGCFVKTDNDKFAFTPKSIDEAIAKIVKEQA